MSFYHIQAQCCSDCTAASRSDSWEWGTTVFIAQDLIKLIILSSVFLHFTVLFRWGGKREAVVIGMSDIRLYCS